MQMYAFKSLTTNMYVRIYVVMHAFITYVATYICA